MRNIFCLPSLLQIATNKNSEDTLSSETNLI